MINNTLNIYKILLKPFINQFSKHYTFKITLSLWSKLRILHSNYKETVQILSLEFASFL